MAETSTQDDRAALTARLDAALPERLHVFVGPEDGVYTAYAVEFDIVGQGDSCETALRDMFDLVREYVHTAVELDELDKLVRPMPRSEVLRLQFKVLRSRAAQLKHRSAAFVEKKLDHAALQHELA